MQQTDLLSVSVVICAYTEDRWDDLVAAVASVEAQSLPAHEVILVIDHNPALLARCQAEFPRAIVIANEETKGLSGARNCGTRRASGQVVAFLDDDAWAESDWLEHLVSGYDDPAVLGVGGKITPAWGSGARPRAFPEEFDWVVGCTYKGMPEDTAPVRNMIGANMSFRREVFGEVGGFHSGLGRVGTLPLGCEETELCLRVSARWPEATFLYEPRARVSHRVPQGRGTFTYFRRRTYAEGVSKARVTQLAGKARGLASERTYALRTLPQGMVRGLVEAIRQGDMFGVGRAFAIGLGLMLTIAGYLWGSTLSSRTRKQRAGNGGAKERTMKDNGQKLSHNDALKLALAPTELSSGRRLEVATRPRSPKDGYIEFDFHGRASMRVARNAATAQILRDMLAPFETTGLGHFDLTVTGKKATLANPSHAEHAYRYTEEGLHLLAMDVEILMGDEIRLNGTRELLTAAIPLIDSIMVGRDAAMIHAATVSYRGHGVAMPAWGGVGKTSTVAKLLRLPRVSFMGDDWGFMSGDGQLLGYAKPMFIKPHHRPIYPHLFEGKRKPLIPKKLSKPVSQFATLVHPYITKHPRLAGFTRRWSPEHMMVTPRQAFPDAPIATAAPLATSVFVERFDGEQAILEAKDTAWMVARIIGNFHAELPGHSRDVITALAATGLVPMERFYAEKAAVLTRALENKPCFSLRVPAWMPADLASDVIVEHLREVFRASGIE